MRKIDETLWTLARYPFLSADDLALLTGTHVRAARAHLLRLTGAGLIECVHLPVSRAHLYYLTPVGIAAAASVEETNPAVLAARYGLGDRSLLRRLPGLDRLVAGRRVLLALQRALAVRGGALEDWRAWPVPWPYTRGSQRRVLYLDGEGAIRLSGSGADRRPFGFVWDGDGAVPAAVLSEQLAHLDLLSASPTYNGPRGPRGPPVLVVTTAADRGPPGYRPGIIWTTRVEIEQDGLLDAPWRGTGLRGDALPLLAALDQVSAGLAHARIGAPLSRGGEQADDDATHIRPPRLQQRADALRQAAGETGSPALLALVIPPRGVEILDVVGAHPLLSAVDIARACALNSVDSWDVLGLLCRHHLVVAWMPPRQRGRRRDRCRTVSLVYKVYNRRVRRYVLTTRGLRFLAARVGVTPEAYRRIHGVLDDRVETAKKRRGLRFAWGNLAHTDGINQVYLALLDAARATGAELAWRGEWACTQPYEDGPDLRTLRPDAEVRYAGPDGGRQFFVEVDRGTKRLDALQAKLAQYGAYRAGTGRDQVTVLVVTTGYERGWEVLHLNETLRRDVGTRPLDLLVTTRAEVAERVAQARIWRVTAGPCAALHAYLNELTHTVHGAPRLPGHLTSPKEAT